MSEAIQRHMAPMPAWLVFSGATACIVGASITKHAESIGELIVDLDRRANLSNLAAVAPGEWGLGLLIVGAVVTLSGLVVAARRPNLNVTEPVTATSLESATSRGREPRQLLDMSPSAQVAPSCWWRLSSGSPTRCRSSPSRSSRPRSTSEPTCSSSIRFC
jgi:hypothetical protein